MQQCPNDRKDMVAVWVSSAGGQAFVVDQCPDCGGIWFDEYEIYRAKDGEANRIEQVDPVALAKPAAVAASLSCPRDGSPLLPLKDAYFPKGVVVARCPRCNGFWLNRGEFARYQDARRKLSQPSEVIIGPGDGLRSEIDAALRPGLTTDSPVFRAAKFLSTPLDQATLKPLDASRGSATEEGVNTALTVLSTLLRLLLFR